MPWNTALSLFFVQAIETELAAAPSMRFYVATDEDAVIRELAAQYGEKLFWQQDCIKDRKSAAAIQGAAVDLLMLAGADKIYGSAGSTFSTMAVELGGKELLI